MTFTTLEIILILVLVWMVRISRVYQGRVGKIANNSAVWIKAATKIMTHQHQILKSMSQNGLIDKSEEIRLADRSEIDTLLDTIPFKDEKDDDHAD
jgi:hypothetical protein